MSRAIRGAIGRDPAADGAGHRSSSSGGTAEARQGEGWRPDVDGLRAVAVLAVIVFHLRRDWLPGGFAGVDVFFVISGFLITRAILADLAAGTFSRAEFYRRRVKRISLPMLAVVLVVVASAQLLLMPEDALEAAWSGVASVLSCANVYFWLWLDRGYFARNAEVPLLHLWSLGVEEQFYLSWPWIVPWLAGRGLATRGEIGGATAGTEPGPASRGITAGRAFLVALVAAASFAAGDPAFSPSPSFAYYMLPTRAGGLLVGAMLAFAVAAGVLASPGRAFRETVGWFGAALLLGSFVLLSDREPYPGWRAIPPALGAVLVLLSGQGAPSLVSRALSVGPLVAVGLVSYAAYLWHWPLIAFWIYGFRRVGDAAALGILATTFVLAGASRRWIEGPARRTSASPGRVALVQWVVPGAVVLAVAALAIATGGFGPRALSKRYVDGLAAADLHLRTTLGSESVCQHMRPDAGLLEADRCVTGAPAAPGGVLLWGDSHAGHYVGMLDVIARASGFRFRNFPTSGCPPVLDRPGRFAKWDRRAYCDRSSRQVARDLDRYPVVVLGVAWAAYEAAGGIEAVFETARRLVASGHRVILLGQVQFFPGAWGMWDPDCPRKALSFPGLACSRRVGAPIEPEILRIDERVRDFAQRTPGVSYFDANEESCPDGTCRLYGEDGVALYSDLWHLSMAGSMRLGEAVLRSRGVPPPFDQVPAWLADAARGSSSPPRAVEPGAGEEPEGPGRTRSGPGDSRT